MSNKTSHFWCPNCFRRLEKDDSILWMTSGVGFVGYDFKWSGNLEADIHNAKRVMLCKRCNKPLDFHALLRGKLDYRGFAAWAILIFIGGLVYLLRYRGFSFWPAAGISLAGSLLIGYLLNELEKKLASRWRFTEQQVQEIKAKEIRDQMNQLKK